MTESAHRARSIWNAPPLRYPHSRNTRKGWNSVQLSTPKQVQTQETKQKIYKAASSILKKKGYAYLTVSNICAVAGVSNGTFFYHFKTKDELLVYYNYQKFAEFREKNNFSEAVAGKPFDERILLFYYYWSDYMLDVGLDFCCNYYNTKNAPLASAPAGLRLGLSRQLPAGGRRAGTAQARLSAGSLRRGRRDDHEGHRLRLVSERCGVRYARAPGRDHGAVSQEHPDGPAGDDRRIRRDHTVKQTEKQ